HVPHDQIVPVWVLLHLRRRSSRLLVVVLAVNQRGEPVTCVALDTLPDVEYGTTGGIHENTADLAQRLEIVDGHAEGRHDNDVFWANRAKIERTGRIRTEQNIDAHVPQPVVDERIVNDFADEEDPLVRKLATRLISVLDRPLHPVTESEFAREMD